MTSYDGRKQVNRSHYFSSQYLDQSRFLGLSAQFNSIDQVKPNGTILEIGPGPGFFSLLGRHCGKNITTVDLDVELCPDLVSVMPNLPFISESFDVVCAFEVLEHLPFGMLGDCLEEMARITAKHVIVSVPNIKHVFPKIKIIADVKIGRLKFFSNYYFTKHKHLCNLKEHYWEIGFNDYTEQKVIDIAESVGLKLLSSKFFDPWFQFFSFSNDLRK